MILEYLQKRWFLIGVLIGVVLVIRMPEQARTVFGYVDIRYVAGISLFLTSLLLATRRLWEAIQQPGPVLLALALTWGAAPLVAYFVAPWLLPASYRDGLIIVCCAPCTLASAVVWTGLGGGNQAIALMMTMLTNTFAFVGTAGWLSVLTGQSVQFDVQKMVTQLVIYVVVPIIIAQVVRQARFVDQAVSRWKQTISVVCRVAIMLIIIKSAAETNHRLAADGEGQGAWRVSDLVLVALVCASVHILLLLTGYFTGRRLFTRPDALAVGISGSQKTLPVGALIVDQFFQHAPLAIVPVLFYHVGQLLIDTYFIEYFARGAPEPDELLSS